MATLMILFWASRSMTLIWRVCVMFIHYTNIWTVSYTVEFWFLLKQIMKEIICDEICWPWEIVFFLKKWNNVRGSSAKWWSAPTLIDCPPSPLLLRILLKNKKSGKNPEQLRKKSCKVMICTNFDWLSPLSSPSSHPAKKTKNQEKIQNNSARYPEKLMYKVVICMHQLWLISSR